MPVLCCGRDSAGSRQRKPCDCVKQQKSNPTTTSGWSSSSSSSSPITYCLRACLAWLGLSSVDQLGTKRGRGNKNTKQGQWVACLSPVPSCPLLSPSCPSVPDPPATVVPRPRPNTHAPGTQKSPPTPPLRKRGAPAVPPARGFPPCLAPPPFSFSSFPYFVPFSAQQVSESVH